MRLIQRLLPAILLLTLTIASAACSTSDRTKVMAGSELPDPVQTPTPQIGTAEEAPTTAEPAIEPTSAPTEAPDDNGLFWTEVDLSDALGADEASTIRLESVGDGRVLAMSFVDRGMNVIMTTENAREWTPISVPTGFLPWSIDITGDRWLIQGWDSTLESPFAQILYSDDEGATWTEIVVDLAAFGDTAWVVDAIAAGERIVIVAISDGAPLGAAESLEEETEYESSVHLFFSDGEPAELVSEFAGWYSGGHGASDSFRLIASDSGDNFLLASPDGREWTRTAVDAEVTDGARNEMWTSDEGYTDYRIERFEGVYGSGQVLTRPEGIGWVPDIAVGPAGIAMVGGPEASPTSNSQYDPNKFLVGWSMDGIDWEWQTLQEAFGIPERTEDSDTVTEVQVAVGQDFVLAKVQTFVFPEEALYEDTNIGIGDGQSSALLTATEISASSHRWFIARVS